MELGNRVFGNSRGRYPVPRNESWEGEFRRLFRAVGLDERGDRVPGVAESRPGAYKTFENDLFWVMPYYWGGCTCGWDEIDNGHQKAYNLKHRPECIQNEIERLDKRYYFTDRERFYSSLKRLYQQRGLPTDGEDWWHGCMLRCDCDFNERLKAVYREYAKQFGHEGHKPDCLLVVDNFHFKPTGFGIQWYKYPLRDSYMSQPLSLGGLRQMIDECVASVRKEAS